MKILAITQNTEEWLEFRKGKQGGSNAGNLTPLTRGADRTPTGIWQVLAERIADNAGGESPIERGHRLENEALDMASEFIGKPINKDCGVWVSDFSDDIYVSPDGAEPGDNPKYAAEAKCLSSAKHLQTIYKDLIARLSPDYSAIDQIPNDARAKYQDQVVHYFVVNERLETLYFVLYDDRIDPTLDLNLYVITVKRKDIEDKIQAQTESQKQVNAMLNRLVAAFTKHAELPEFGYKKEVKDGQKTA